MLLDVIYIMKQFVGPIPHKCDVFKKTTHKTFPKWVDESTNGSIIEMTFIPHIFSHPYSLLDTKYMCTDDTLKPYINSSVLARLLDTTSIEPFSRPSFGKKMLSLIDDWRSFSLCFPSVSRGWIWWMLIFVEQSKGAWSRLWLLHHWRMFRDNGQLFGHWFLWYKC